MSAQVINGAPVSQAEIAAAADALDAMFVIRLGALRAGAVFCDLGGQQTFEVLDPRHMVRIGGRNIRRVKVVCRRSPVPPGTVLGPVMGAFMTTPGTVLYLPPSTEVTGIR